jgi:hypothetical protein
VSSVFSFKHRPRGDSSTISRHTYAASPLAAYRTLDRSGKLTNAATDGRREKSARASARSLEASARSLPLAGSFG